MLTPEFVTIPTKDGPVMVRRSSVQMIGRGPQVGITMLGVAGLGGPVLVGADLSTVVQLVTGEKPPSPDAPGQLRLVTPSDN